MISNLSFKLLVKEVLEDVTGRAGVCVSPDFLEALQEAAEAYLVELFEDSYVCTQHRGCTTLLPKDMHLAMLLRPWLKLNC